MAIVLTASSLKADPLVASSLIDKDTVNLWIFSRPGPNCDDSFPGGSQLSSFEGKLRKLGNGPAGPSWIFSGTDNDFLLAAKTSSLGKVDNTHYTVTIEAWLKVTGTNTKPLMGIAENCDYLVTGWRVMLDNQLRPVFIMEDAPNKRELNLQAEDKLAIGKWYHLACTYNGSEMDIYIDGIRKASGPFTGPFTPPVNPLRATNGTASGGGYPFIGEISALRVSGVARTDFPQYFPDSD